MSTSRGSSRGSRLRNRDSRSQQLLDPGSQLSQLRYVPKTLGLVWEAAPGRMILTVVLLVIQGLLPVFSVYLTRWLVNSLVVVVESGGDPETLRPAVIAITLMGGVLLVGQILASASAYVRVALAERIQDHMNGRIHEKAISLDLEFYESATYYDQLQRASVDAIDRPLGLLDSLGALLQNTITLVAMAGVLLSYVWWMPLVLIVGTLPALWVALRTTWKFHIWRTLNTINQRRLSYYHYTLISDQAAPELRLFNLGQHFIQAYSTLRKRLHHERLALARDQMTGQMAAGLMGLLSLALAMAWIAWKAFQGLYNLGDMAMFWQAMNQGQRLMQSLLSGVGDIYRNLLFLEDLFVFLELEPKLIDPPDPRRVEPGLHQGISLNEVTFSYPDSPRTALNEFSLEIPSGQVVAIVGENGAGKSTLIKLICRFYDPQEGSITWDGVDLRQFAQADLRRRITVLFQEPQAYHDTVFDNIAFGDLANRPDPQAVAQAARDGGAESIIQKLPEEYETVLGKWFGYTNLSVGEWQRIALARAFVRRAELVILDEPTSAMDSWAENEWMGRFRQLVHGRTAIIITHRFTTAMQADIIHVMADGGIVESGTHAELMALSGRYAQSWRQQIREAGIASLAAT